MILYCILYVCVCLPVYSTVPAPICDNICPGWCDIPVPFTANVRAAGLKP